MSDPSQTPSILAIDTATNLCSVALVSSSEIKEIQRDIPRAHNQHILAMVDEVLEGRTLRDAVSVIACGVGPGSFTGIRVSVGVAQGLGWSLELPIYPFCSLAAQAMAGSNNDSHRILSTIDAQIGQVYWAWFESRAGTVRPLTAPAITRVADITVPSVTLEPTRDNSSDLIVGDAADVVRQEVKAFAPCQTASHIRPQPSRSALCFLDNYDAQKLIKAQELEPHYVQQDIGWKKLAEQGKRV